MDNEHENEQRKERRKENIGGLGENTAATHLRQKGYKILARNWQNKWGEIDLVAKPKRGKAIVFVEVKTISQNPDFQAAEHFNLKKQKQLLKMAQLYLSASRLPLDTACQIDLITIEICDGPEKLRIRHFENVVEDLY